MTNYKFSDERCDNCGSNQLIIKQQEGCLVCKNCGNVIRNFMIDYGREWRVFFGENEEISARTGAPIRQAIHDKGITTEIKISNNAKNNEKIKVLSIYQKRLRVNNSKERNLYSAFTLLEEVSVKLELPERVKETAAMLYRKVSESKATKGKSIRGILANCIYQAARLCDYPLRIKTVTDALNVKSRTFSKYYNMVQDVMPKDNSLKAKGFSCVNYIPQLVSMLGLGADVEIVSKNILEHALNNGMLAGKPPVSLAAAAVYIACTLTNKRRTQRQIAECAGVTEVTIRNRSKELIRNLAINIHL